MRDDDRHARHQQTTNGYTVVTFCDEDAERAERRVSELSHKVNADRSDLIVVVLVPGK